MKRSILFLICLCIFGRAYTQELNLDVSVLTPQLNTTDPKVFKAMERDIEEFFNNQKFTDDDYEPEERIQGNMQITITQESGSNSFVINVAVQSIRPVYNSTYSTQLLNYLDKDSPITYVQNQAIQNSKDKYFDNLSSIMTFYAYVIIGLDYDSFSSRGGEQFFRIAQDVINLIPTSLANSDGSWSNNTRKRGRYWLIENIFNPRMKVMREAFYTYHRHGLDAMYEDAGKGRAVMFSALKDINSASDSYPNSMFVQMFTDAKNEEIIDIFLVSNTANKLQVYDFMVNIDPYRASTYSKLR